MMLPSLFGNGGPTTGVFAQSSTFTVAATDIAEYFNCTGTFTINLPAAATAGNGFTIFVRTVSGTQTIDPSGAELINGASTLAISNAGDVWMVVCTGTAWLASRMYQSALTATTITASSSLVVGGAVNAIGGATSSQAVLQVGSTASLGSTTERGINIPLTGSSSATTSIRGVQVSLGTSAAAYTCADVFGWYVATMSLGSGSSITRTTNYVSTRQTIGTSNFGFFHGATPTADTGQWALYNNTADANYLGTGATLINTKTDDGTNKLQVSGGVSTGALTVSSNSTLTASSNAALGWTINNTNTSTAAESRLTFLNDASKSILFSLGGSGNTGTIFGLTRANLGFLVCGVSGTMMAIGTLASSSPVVIGCEGTERARFSTTNGNLLINTATDDGTNRVQINGSLSVNSAIMIATKTNFTNGAAAAAGTLTNAPVAGNPTKWIPVNDNGTTRYIPAW